MYKYISIYKYTHIYIYIIKYIYIYIYQKINIYLFVSVCNYPWPPKEETQYDRERAHTHTTRNTS